MRFIFVVFIACFSNSILAQENEVAILRGMVERLLIENNELRERLETVEKRPHILASIKVINRVVVFQTAGVAFNSSSGEITFQNPDNLPIAPIISDLSERNYISETHFIMYSSENNKVKIWQTDLTTGDGNISPDNFSLLVVAFPN